MKRDKQNFKSRGSRSAVGLVVSFFLGGLVLCLLSIVQKLAVGFPISFPKGYLIPLFFGGTSGTALWLAYSRLRATKEALQQAGEVMEARIKERTLDLEREVAGRKRIERASRLKHQQLVTMFDSVSETVYVSDPETHEVLFANRVVREAFGEVVGRKCYEAFQGFSEPCPFCTNPQLFGPEAVPEVTWELYNHQLERWYHCVDRAIDWPDGRRVHFQTATDITDRKKAEDALRESEELYRVTFESIPDVITVSRMEDGRYVKVNDGFCALTGYSREEVIGKTPFDLDIFVNPEDRNKMISLLREEGKVSNLEIQFRIKDGTILDSLLSAESFRYGGEDCLVAVVKNITSIKHIEKEKAKLETQLFQAQKMEAVGTLASGIAHDFNNILQAISGYVQLMQLDAAETHPQSEYLNWISAAIERAAELTHRLLAFGREVEVELKPLDLNREVENTVRMMERTIPKMIEIQTRLADGLKPVRGSPVQLAQVLMNLGTNAADAMPDGGRLVIETENVQLDEEYCRARPGLQPGEYVLLTVSDTGCGMDKETLQRIFDPFFTTKEVGKGTGLGLFTVYGIVKNHGGHITCSSEPGQGTTFKLHLPAAAQTDDSDQAAPFEPSTETLEGDESILLVDDEPALLEAAKQYLEKYGYTVITAASGEEALAVYERKGGDIDLVVLDLVMPGMGGQKCLERLLAFDPRAKIVVASGYSADGQAKTALDRGAAGFIAKPYRLKKMLEIVRWVLNQTE